MQWGCCSPGRPDPVETGPGQPFHARVRCNGICSFLITQPEELNKTNLLPMLIRLGRHILGQFLGRNRFQKVITLAMELHRHFSVSGVIIGRVPSKDDTIRV